MNKSLASPLQKNRNYKKNQNVLQNAIDQVMESYFDFICMTNQLLNFLKINLNQQIKSQSVNLLPSNQIERYFILIVQNCIEKNHKYQSKNLIKQIKVLNIRIPLCFKQSAKFLALQLCNTPTRFTISTKFEIAVAQLFHQQFQPTSDKSKLRRLLSQIKLLFSVQGAATEKTEMKKENFKDRPHIIKLIYISVNDILSNKNNPIILNRYSPPCSSQIVPKDIRLMPIQNGTKIEVSRYDDIRVDILNFFWKIQVDIQ